MTHEADTSSHSLDGSEWSVLAREEAADYDEAQHRPEDVHISYGTREAHFRPSRPSGPTDRSCSEFDTGAGGVIFCRVFFQEQFEALRRRCGLEAEGSFIDSLARCIKWDSSGGKSGSAFLKTRGALDLGSCATVCGPS